MDESTFRELVARGDIYIRDGDGDYRPLAEGDGGREMYLLLHNGQYQRMDMVGGQEPPPPPARSPTPAGGAHPNSVMPVVADTVNDAVERATAWGGGCLSCLGRIALAFIGISIVGGTIDTFGLKGLLWLVLVVIVVLVLRKKPGQ